MIQQVGIIGGGLAGLTAAIHLCKAGIQVTLFERNSYPHHKVCGEYLSNEILPYLDYLGIVLPVNCPRINNLKYSTHKGASINCDLELGGIGLSRFTFDELLYKNAISAGCHILKTTVIDIKYNEGTFQISTSDNSFDFDYVLGAFGKRSGLDKILARENFNKKSEWLAVKNHYINNSFPSNRVELHNFQGGYCGLSRTDVDTVNVCYLTSYKSFKRYKDHIEFKESVLKQNPHLKRFFEESRQVFKKDISIAQISFGPRELVEKHILMIGDAAGLIHPLSGNGMSMAIHSAKIAAESLLEHSVIPDKRSSVERIYRNRWQKEFWLRMKTGKVLQQILLNPALASFSQNILQYSPTLLQRLIRLTHGKKVYA